MNWDQVEGKWKQMKGAVKEKWGKLTDDDLDRIAGKRDKLAGRLQECYGLHKEVAEKQCDEWCNTAEDIMNKESAAQQPRSSAKNFSSASRGTSEDGLIVCTRLPISRVAFIHSVISNCAPMRLVLSWWHEATND
jgi:uncharacterized protein YjbJ (UPF0337 family)